MKALPGEPIGVPRRHWVNYAALEVLMYEVFMCTNRHELLVLRVLPEYRHHGKWRERIEHDILERAMVSSDRDALIQVATSMARGWGKFVVVDFDPDAVLVAAVTSQVVVM